MYVLLLLMCDFRLFPAALSLARYLCTQVQTYLASSTSWWNALFLIIWLCWWGLTAFHTYFMSKVECSFCVARGCWSTFGGLNGYFKIMEVFHFSLSFASSVWLLQMLRPSKTNLDIDYSVNVEYLYFEFSSTWFDSQLMHQCCQLISY